MADPEEVVFKEYVYQTQVLIVGAGPTGLAMAASLAKYGIKCRIVDSQISRSTTSKAIGIQAGTLEVLESCFGDRLVDQLIERGYTAHKAFFHVNNRAPQEIDFSTIPSIFNYLLVLEQSETERIFEELLNRYEVKVERNSRFMTLYQDESKVHARVQLQNGEFHDIDCDYLIACDGVNSQVRHTLEIPFEDQIYQGDFILGDIDLDWQWGHESLHAFISDKGLLGCFPIRGDKKFRLIMIQSHEKAPITNDISLEDFTRIANELSTTPIRISEAYWLTRFHLHQRMAERFQQGRVFLMGDAAHVHSPAGGQGLNLGVQEAMNLSYKLMRVLVQGESSEILDDYEKERKPIAQSIMHSTDLLFKIILGEQPLSHFIRGYVAPQLFRIPYVRRRAVKAMSEVKNARDEIYSRQTHRH